MAPNEKHKGCARGRKPHHDHHHHRRHHHHSPPPPPHLGFHGPPGFMESHPWPHCDPRFSHHHHPPGHEGFFHAPPPHHRFGGGRHGRRCWPDPRGSWWEDSSDEEDGTDPSRDDHPERFFPRPGGRHGWGGSRGFGRGMWGPRGGGGRGGGGRGGFGRGGFGGHFFGPSCGPPRHGFGLASQLPFGHHWFEDSDSSSSSEDEAAGADYKATFDLGQYKKKNIIVRLAGRHLTVGAKGKGSQGLSDQRPESCRRYFVEHRNLPKKVDGCRMTAILNSDGLLTVRAPPCDESNDEDAGICEREVQIQDEVFQADECMDADVDRQGQDSEKDE
ncbi:uncharacterized protein LOC119727424 [Patiria miniata]|uniref:SHSP domain-containing protein n=1 Tax=Patiria miniata TaxID=46514 RepID=A0A913ZUS3_PATMI|nr:uncharacterized protein LOC119727424 [Patiria miniata]